jgi:hypothetical protein
MKEILCKEEGELQDEREVRHLFLLRFCGMFKDLSDSVLCSSLFLKTQIQIYH